jgi:hypothetical protein
MPWNYIMWQNITVCSLVSNNPKQTCDPSPSKCLWTDCWTPISWSCWQSLGASNLINFVFKNTAFGTKRTANYAQILILIFQFIIISSSCPNCLSKQLSPNIFTCLADVFSLNRCWPFLGRTRPCLERRNDN